MQLLMLAVVAVVVAEVVVEETEVAKVVITPVTIVPRPLKTLMLLIALRRRRKVFGSNLLTIKTFMTMLARYAIAPPRRTIAIYTLSADSDRML
mgnify:CR=1 FL=1|jgi:hypothetical protein